MKKFRKVVVGGTFEFLHLGHRTLIEKAFEVGEYVIIGLTSEKFKKGSSPYEYRERKLKNFLKNKKNYEIKKIYTPYDIAVELEDLEAIIVSDETEWKAREINKIRERKGFKPLEIIKIPMILAYDGKPISSSRIKKGEIWENGSKKNKNRTS